MKKFLNRSLPAISLLGLALCFGIQARAEEQDTIKTGIYAGAIPLGGMTKEEADREIQSFVENLGQVQITLLAAAGKEVVVNAGEFGIRWANPELTEEAAKVGTRGNVIQRYKVLKDLEHDSLVYDILLSLDLQAVGDVLIQKCSVYDSEASDMSLIRENGEFRIIEGTAGYFLDVETSIDNVNDFLTGDWDYRPCEIALNVEELQPRGTKEQLSAVRDVLGSFTTVYSTSAAGRKANVENGCQLIDGTLLYPGDEFSAHDATAPYTEQNGYHMAGSYVGGRVVDSVGGGVCQVSTTLYNAVLGAELEVKKRYSHSMTVSYVDISADAALAESSGKDFVFVNNTEYPIYIEGQTGDRRLTFTIYGVETRPAGRSVRYESEVLETISPSGDVIRTDDTLPVGYLETDSAYTGYKARLWKIVEEDGVEVSRTQVNSSTYKMVPRSATVGTATGDEAVRSELQRAVESGNIDVVKNVLAALTAPPVPETPVYENGAEED